LTSFAPKSYFKTEKIFSLSCLFSKFPQTALFKVMNSPETEHLSKNNVDIFKLNHLILAVFSLGALIVTFFTANSGIEVQTKIIVFLCIVVLYLLCCAAFYVLQKRRLSISLESINDGISGNIFGSEVEMKLLALEEANQFFGASLKSADMFQFVSSRIREIIPFASSTLFLVNEDKTQLKAAFADGENAEGLAQLETDFYKGLAGKTYVSRKAQFDDKLPLGKTSASYEALKNLNSAVSVPLFRDAEVFGVLMLYGKGAKDFDADSLRLLEAVGTRVAPLFLSSFAFEKSLSNALTDSLTNLPNKRAFYLIVENKIAESQRFRNDRPLTILAVDIKDFKNVNQKYGHATGDRILAFVAKTLKEQLREMDFLARSTGDEFLAVLPTADEQITKEIIERVERAFVSNPFVVTRQEKINLELNFGAASFWKDGETVSQLLQHADLRKQQSKSTQKSKVLWFPKEYVN
jgi:diguanylate cyclase (GGDEF)-like protein